MDTLRRDIAVVGGGLAGLATAVGLADAGFDTVLVAPTSARKDGRSTALIGPSVALMKRIGVFDHLAGKTAPLAMIRIVDDTRRLIHAPTLEFKAAEIGLSAFGHNVLNSDITEALRETALTLSQRLTITESALADLEIEAEEARLTLGDGRRIVASLVVGADGRNSLVRSRAGIGLREWRYPQSAIVLNFRHDFDHFGISTEFHTRTGPFTQVPLPGRMSSLVWVETPENADLFVDLKPERLSRMVEERLHSILGAVEIDGEVQTFPLHGASAERMTRQRVALVGESAHVFPPIGAQGLNLGLRDAAALIEAVSLGRDDPGGGLTLSRYESSRRADVATRTLGVDLLNRSLLAGMLPVQAARTIGLSALAHLPHLRRFAMREGVSPGAGFAGLPAALSDVTDSVGAG